jgi:hypothetical protein
MTTTTTTVTAVCNWRTDSGSSVRITRDADGRLIANGRRLPPHFSAAMELALRMGAAAPAHHREVYAALYWGHDRVHVPAEHRCREWGITMARAWDEREAIMGLASLRARGLPEHLDRMVGGWIESR